MIDGPERRPSKAVDPEERRRAIRRSGDREDAPPVEVLVAALGDSDWRVRKEAAAVTAMLPPSEELLQGLIQAFEPGPNVGLRNAAVETLAGFGAPAVRALSERLPKLDADGRKLAAETFARSQRAEALEPLLGLLDDPDPNVRVSAVEAIAEVGSSCPERAVPWLEQCLTQDDTMLRLAAIGALNQLGVSLPWALVEQLLTDPVLRPFALEAASRSADRNAIPLLVESLESSRGAAFASAVGALASLARANPESFRCVQAALVGLSQKRRQRLRELVTDPSVERSTKADVLVVLACLDPKGGAEIAVSLLGDIALASAAEHALQLLGASAIGVLTEAARSGSRDERVACIDLISRLPEPADDQTRQLLLDALEDPSQEVARAAYSALGAVGDEPCLQQIAEGLAQLPSPILRNTAAAALAALARRFPDQARSLARSIGVHDAAALASTTIHGALPSPVRQSEEADLAFLSEATNSADPTVRRAAVEALTKLGEAAVESIGFALADEARDVQLAAVRALGKMRDERAKTKAIDRLMALLSSDDTNMLVASLAALGEANAVKALPSLRPLVRSDEARIAVAAVESVGRLEGPGRVEVLIEALCHGNTEVVKAALLSLAGQTERQALPHLDACLDHSAWEVRRLAADLLGKSEDRSRLSLLRTKLEKETEPLVIEALRRSIAQLEEASGVRRSSAAGALKAP